MDWVVELLISKYLWWIIAIIIWLFTIFVTYQSLMFGLGINSFVKFLWLLSIVAVAILFFRNFIEYVKGDTTSQIILFALVIGYLWFMPVKTKTTTKRGTRR